jgi:hypothetical protein
MSAYGHGELPAEPDVRHPAQVSARDLLDLAITCQKNPHPSLGEGQCKSVGRENSP